MGKCRVCGTVIDFVQQKHNGKYYLIERCQGCNDKINDCIICLARRDEPYIYVIEVNDVSPENMVALERLFSR